MSQSDELESEYHDTIPENNVNGEIYGLYKKAIEMEMDEEKLDCLSSETLVQLIIENKIGGFGKEFFTDYISEYY